MLGARHATMLRRMTTPELASLRVLPVADARQRLRRAAPAIRTEGLAKRYGDTLALAEGRFVRRGR